LEKTLIEEPTVDLLELLDMVSEEAKIEKNAVPPINNMLYWWTRKPLIVGRAVALASTLDNIDDVRNLLHLRREKRAYTYTPDIGIYKKKLGRDPFEIKTLDPFGGAGNLIYEPKQLGLDCTVSDYNPIPYLIQKAVLEYPAKYGVKLAEDFEKYANEVIEMTKKEVGKFYNDNDLAYIWFWCVKCPHCSQRVPLTNQSWIVNNTKKKIGVKFHVTSDKNFTIELIKNMSKNEGENYTKKGRSGICISCKNSINYETITNDVINRKDQELVAKQFQKSGNRDFIKPSEEDKKLYKNAVKYFELKKSEFEKDNLIPNEEIYHDPRSPLRNYGIKRWNEFFNERQLLFLVILLKNIKIVLKKIDNKDSQKVLSVYLGFLLARIVTSNALGTTWNTKGEKPEGALSLRRPSFVFYHVEINPFEKVRGSLSNILKNIKNAIEYASKNKNPIQTANRSVTKYHSPTYSGKYDLIITDPPYGDDVQYGELSEFFYVWVYRCVKDYFPELPSRVSLDEDFCESAGRFGNKQLAHDFLEKGFEKSFIAMNQALKQDGLLVVFFAHSSIKLWNLLLNSLKIGQFKVISSYAIHTESRTNVLAHNKTSFMSSIVVTCRKLSNGKSAFFEDIIPQIEDIINSMVGKIPMEKLLVLPITDLLIMVYGKVLEVCTQFTELKSYEKDFTPDFETLIKGSQSFIMKTIITRLTERSLNTLGSLTAFYLLTKIFYRGIMSPDDALKIARTYGMNVDILEKNNVGKKEDNIIRLFYLHENELDLKPEEIDRGNIHQQLCYLVQVSKKEGVAKVNSIISKKEFRVDDLKQIILLLIKSLRLRINKNEKVNDDEKEELRLLESIADVMGIKTSTEKKGGMDEFL